MMLMRVELYCHGFPDGNVPHGHVDVQVRGSDEEAKEAILSQISRDCYMGDGTCWVDFELVRQEVSDFDYGDTFATVVSGEGDAFAQNPVGKQFSLM